MTDTEELVWHNTVDGGAWDCRVVRNGPGTGTLFVTRVLTGEVVLDQVVTLSYGAIFGPDVADVQGWEVMSIRAIDGATGSLSEPAEGNES